MNEIHASLTLRAASVAASALRTISALQPLLGHPGASARRFEEALQELGVLYHPPKPRPKRSKRPVALAKAPKHKLPKRTPRFEEEDDLDAPSAWDPEPIYEASRCQAFLMEIIRRAAHDWVLYRQARKMELKALAEQAYIWLFEEEPGHPAWKDRERALFRIEDEVTKQPAIEVGTRRLTSFLSICEACGLDPETVRDRAREMTVEQVTRTGRRIERRNNRQTDYSATMDTHSVIDGVDIESIEMEFESAAYNNYNSFVSDGIGFSSSRM